jgi:hypothetical protein
VRPQPFITSDPDSWSSTFLISLVFPCLFPFLSFRLSENLLQEKQAFSIQAHRHVSHVPVDAGHSPADQTRMSLAPYYYRPITPPEAAAGQRGHRRNYSNVSAASSYYSSTFDTSPESVITDNTTPSRSPVLRHNGPTLLPKIRTQDSSLNPASAGQIQGAHRRGSSTSNISVSNQRPPMYRSATVPVESTSLASPISNPAHSRASSVNPQPSPGLAHASLYRTKKAHSRAGSTSSLDSSVLSRYGYPTYRQVPVYQQQTPSPAFYPQEYMQCQSSNLVEPPMINLEGTFDMPIDLETISRPTSMSPPPAMLPSQPAYETCSLLGYLTQPTQPINLVRHLSSGPGRGMVSHFWWDVRALRPWTDFNFTTFSAIPDLMTLLTYQHSTSSLPSYAVNGSTLQTLSPSNESDLTGLITKTYFPRANAAAVLTLGGPNSIAFYQTPTAATPTPFHSPPNFLANYPSDGDRTLSGIPRGRIVGLAKSFDKWNTGMRREGPARKVEYLKGLAHLQKCMRDHSCRYGFIITEIELLCVRTGCDERGSPYFGKLELAEAIPINRNFDASSYDANVDDIPMTATMGLYFLLMLAKSTPLPGQASSFMDVGGPGALTRQRVWNGEDIPEEERGKEGRDKWIPEPQVGEKREAKTVRGWVWPSDPWSKRENLMGGKRRG